MDEENIITNDQTYKNRHVSRFIAILSVYSCLIKEDGSIKKLASSVIKMKKAYFAKDIFIENLVADKLDDLELEEPDEEFLSNLVDISTINESKIEEVILSSLNDKWRFDKLDQVIRAILKLAVAEILYNGELHQSIIIDEYVSLTKTFYDNSEAGFINKVLDVIAKKVRT